MKRKEDIIKVKRWKDRSRLLVCGLQNTPNRIIPEEGDRRSYTLNTVSPGAIRGTHKGHRNMPEKAPLEERS